MRYRIRHVLTGKYLGVVLSIVVVAVVAAVVVLVLSFVYVHMFIMIITITFFYVRMYVCMDVFMFVCTYAWMYLCLFADKVQCSQNTDTYAAFEDEELIISGHPDEAHSTFSFKNFDKRIKHTRCEYESLVFIREAVQKLWVIENTWHTFSKVLCMVLCRSQCTRTLTF